MIEPFWVYLACFIAMLACTSAVEWCKKRGHTTAIVPILMIGIVGAAVIFGKGALMAIDWSNPFVGRAGDLAKSVHSPKAAVFAAIIIVWPFALMALAGFFGFLFALMAKRQLRI